MKYLSIFLLATLLSSCCSTKKTIDNTPKPLAKVTEINEKANEGKIEPPKSNKNSSKILEKEEEPIVEHDTTLELFDHSVFDKLLEKYVSNEGKVNYKGIKDERFLLTEYIKSLNKNKPNDEWDNVNKLAYWINAYNAFTIDLILRHYPVNSIKDIKDPWKQRYWKLGDKWYNLDEIEHQIIRKMGEPRIHFALVCAAVSCPKLYNQAFTASSLDEDLSQLTREFLADETKNNISQNNLKLSKIFSWFSKDFKQDGSLIDFLNQYTDIEISSKAKKRFNTYNWDLNE